MGTWKFKNKVTLTRVLRELVVRMEDGSDRLRIMSSGRLLY
jgi:hypothetical protein